MKRVAEAMTAEDIESFISYMQARAEEATVDFEESKRLFRS